MSEIGKINIGIAGIGLIGGSFAKDLIDYGHGLIAYDINEESCKLAVELGMVLHASSDIKVLDDCAAILIATPVGQTAAVLNEIAKLDTPNLKAVFDAGSTKDYILKYAQSLDNIKDIFVPCHPIAGTEHSGVRAAIKDLYKDKRLIIGNSTANQEAVNLTKALWEQCGARVDFMDTAAHDRMFAAVSHLPHMLAYTLVCGLGERDDRDELLANAASGFADFTRIASSNPQMWRDVCLANKDNLIKEIDLFIEQISNLKNSIKNSNAKEIQEFFANASNLRDNWIATKDKNND